MMLLSDKVSRSLPNEVGKNLLFVVDAGSDFFGISEPGLSSTNIDMVVEFFIGGYGRTFGESVFTRCHEFVERIGATLAGCSKANIKANSLWTEGTVRIEETLNDSVTEIIATLNSFFDVDAPCVGLSWTRQSQQLCDEVSIVEKCIVVSDIAINDSLWAHNFWDGMRSSLYRIESSPCLDGHCKSVSKRFVGCGHTNAFWDALFNVFEVCESVPVKNTEYVSHVFGIGHLRDKCLCSPLKLGRAPSARYYDSFFAFVRSQGDEASAFDELVDARSGRVIRPIQSKRDFAHRFSFSPKNSDFSVLGFSPVIDGSVHSSIFTQGGNWFKDFMCWRNDSLEVRN